MSKFGDTKIGLEITNQRNLSSLEASLEKFDNLTETPIGFGKCGSQPI
jgi:hypothetical protein